MSDSSQLMQVYKAVFWINSAILLGYGLMLVANPTFILDHISYYAPSFSWEHFAFEERPAAIFLELTIQLSGGLSILLALMGGLNLWFYQPGFKNWLTLVSTHMLAYGILIGFYIYSAKLGALNLVLLLVLLLTSMGLWRWKPTTKAASAD